jgi:hypothetical protein
MLGWRRVHELRNFLKDVLPPDAYDWLRRWVLTARYMRFLSYEIHARRTRLESGQLEDLEARLAGPEGGFYRQIVREVVERSDLLLKELDRKLEGQGARRGERLVELENEVKRLREAVDRLAETLGTRGVASMEPRTSTHGQEPAPPRSGRANAR